MHPVLHPLHDLAVDLTMERDMSLFVSPLDRSFVDLAIPTQGMPFYLTNNERRVVARAVEVDPQA